MGRIRWLNSNYCRNGSGVPVFIPEQNPGQGRTILYHTQIAGDGAAGTRPPAAYRYRSSGTLSVATLAAAAAGAVLAVVAGISAAFGALGAPPELRQLKDFAQAMAPSETGLGARARDLLETVETARGERAARRD